LARLYVRLLLRFSPTPDVAFLLDADPEAACCRKPEYPLDFVQKNRDNYLRLARLAGMTVVPALSLDEAKATVLMSVSNGFSRGDSIDSRFRRSAAEDALKSTTS